MAILVSVSARGKRSARAVERASVREVCLIGVVGLSRTRRWSEGDRLDLSGRAYRVESSKAGYLHLASAVEG